MHKIRVKVRNDVKKGYHQDFSISRQSLSNQITQARHQMALALDFCFRSVPNMIRVLIYIQSMNTAYQAY